MKRFFVTGIGTGIGKTLVSAILTEALQADYWKPIQCGNLDDSDTLLVKSLVNNKQSKFHPETYRLSTPASPHYAAQQEGVSINMIDFNLPETNNILVIEGAGGLMVPLNDKELLSDLIVHLEAPVVVVSRNYLGSINHTLLTIECLRAKDITIAGIVFNGEENPASEDAILNFGNIRLLGRVHEESEITPAVISKYAPLFKSTFHQLTDRNEFI